MIRVDLFSCHMSEGESQFLSVIRVWAALAWADNVIQDSEREAITKLVSVAKLEDADRDKAMSFLESKVELDVGPIANLPAEAGHGIYKAALRLALVDLDMAQEEAVMLTRLRKGLGIDDDTAAAIEKSLSA